MVFPPNPIAPPLLGQCHHTHQYSQVSTSEHGAHETYDMKESKIRNLIMKVPYKTLPERLREIGYNTVGISAMIGSHRVQALRGGV